MISIKQAVEKIILNDVDIKNILVKGLLNRTKYAETIVGGLKKDLWKDVSVQSVVMAITRVEKELRGKITNTEEKIEVKQLSIHSDLIDLIFDKNNESIKKINWIIETIKKNNEDFFMISTGTKEISVVVSDNLKGKIISKIKPKKINKNLASMSIQFDEKLVKSPNIGLYFMKLFAIKNIILKKVVTTNNEFSVIFDESFLTDMMSVLKK